MTLDSTTAHVDADQPLRQRRLSLVLVLAGLLFLAFTYFNALAVAQRLPIGLSRIGSIVVVLAVLAQLLTLRQGPRGWPLVFFLWLTFLAAMPSRPWSVYTSSKVTGLFTLTLLCAIGGLYLLRDRRSRQVWLGLVVAMGVAAAGVAITLPDQAAAIGGRLAIEGGSAISAGRATGAAVVVLLALVLGRAPHALWAVALAVGLAVVTIATGSRGPLLSATIALLVVALVPIRQRWIRLMVLAGIVTVSFYAVRDGDFATSRFTSIGASGENRLAFWETTWRLAGSHFMGLGWGGLEPYLNGRDYPHNILLEVLAEAGWLPLALMVAVICIAFARQRRAAATGPVEMAMLGLLVFALVNALVSSDVSGNRGLWVSIGAALLLTTPAVVKPRSSAPLSQPRKGSAA